MAVGRYSPHLIAFLLCTSAAAASPLPASSAAAMPTSATAAAIDRVAGEAIKERVAAGAVVGVADGDTLFVRGYGFADLENRVPVTERTVFRIGSVTKQFTTAALLLLQERGKLSLDDTLDRYFPTFPRGGEVTLRQLATHTSGIHNYTADGFFREAARQDRPTDAMVDYIARQEKPFDFEPGTAWNYSNSGYVLLGAVIEKVAGVPYSVFLDQNILGPLALKDTAVDDLAEIVPGRAHGYEADKEAPAGFVNTSFLSMSAAAAAGAMRSTPADMLAWHRALFGGKLLKPESLAAMTEPARLKDGRLTSAGRLPGRQATPPSDYALGLTVAREEGRRMIGHGGSINGFNATLHTYPDEGVTIVLLTNTSGAAYATAPALAKAYFQARALPR